MPPKKLGHLQRDRKYPSPFPLPRGEGIFWVDATKKYPSPVKLFIFSKAYRNIKIYVTSISINIYMRQSGDYYFCAGKKR
jgi:hypothetical protein